jgi:hypothetical protein
MQAGMGEYMIYEKLLQMLSTTSTETTAGEKHAYSG